MLADGAFRFAALRAGKTLIALQPDRGRSADRKAFYHDPDAPPTHAYLAFYLGLREIERVDALIHLGTHGTTEWLPGKAVALSGDCAPRLAMGALPVIYPFIVDDPGEAAPAKRRLSGVTIGHMTPAVATAELSDDMSVIRELVEEYSSAQVMDPRRAAIVAREIMERAEGAGLFENCGVATETPIDEALTSLDAHLCDLAEVVVRDGLHIFGEGSGELADCATGERDGLLRALDGRFVDSRSSRFTLSRTARRDADGAQPRDARSARGADTGRDRPWRARRRRGHPTAYAGRGRLSAPHRDGPLGISDAAFGRRGYGARAWH